jgi:hypothetical protein
MWPLIKDFFTVKSAGVRTVRVAGAALGSAIAAGQVPMTENWEWVGYVIAIISGAITQQTVKVK